MIILANKSDTYTEILLEKNILVDSLIDLNKCNFFFNQTNKQKFYVQKYFGWENDQGLDYIQILNQQEYDQQNYTSSLFLNFLAFFSILGGLCFFSIPKVSADLITIKDVLDGALNDPKKELLIHKLCKRITSNNDPQIVYKAIDKLKQLGVHYPLSPLKKEWLNVFRNQQKLLQKKEQEQLKILPWILNRVLKRPSIIVLNITNLDQLK